MQVLLPVGTFVAVLAVGVTVALVAGGSDGPARRPLHLATAGRDVAAAPSSAAGAYQLTGPLPEGRPGDAPVWTLGDGVADAGLVRRLAAALHAGQPVRAGAGWAAGGLRVSGDQGQEWSWSRCADGTTVSSEPGGTACARTATAGPGSVSGSAGGSTGGGASGSGGSSTPASPAPAPAPAPTSAPAPAPTPVAEAVVRAAAEPVRTALGLGQPAVTAGPYGGTASWSARVGGLPTAGLTTAVDVDATGAVQAAHGWLAAASRSATYPLVTARAAFDALPSPPRMLMLCPVAPDGTGCLTPPPVEVTGARLGLSLQQLADGGGLLVPSWLFDVKGSDEPLVAVAVVPRWLATGTPTATAAPTAVPASPVTAPPGPPQSAPPTPAPAAVPVPLLSAARTADPAVLSVTYDDGGCGHTGVTSAVKEDATDVVVLLRADPPPPDQGACPAIARPTALLLHLRAPLGTRGVVDGATGKPVTLS